jgi:hypothetical protein
MAAQIDHRIDRGRSPQRPPARDGNPPPGKFRLGFGFIVPVEPWIVKDLIDPRRDRHHQRAVAAAGLQQQDLAVGILAQPAGQDASGRPSPDDDIVIFLRGG